MRSLVRKFMTKGSLTIPVTKNKDEFEIHAGAGSLEITPSNNNQLEIEAEIVTYSVGKKSNQTFIDRYLKLEFEETLYHKGHC